VRTHTAPENVDTNSTLIAYSFSAITWPLNHPLFQIMIVPPDAPLDAMNSKQSKDEGQNFLMKL
jgi:hypothetical protein